jgi:hypothetical protein
MSYQNGPPKIVTDGLLLYLDPITSKSYSIGDNTLYDISSNSYNGTIYGSTYWSDGRGCFYLDGVDDYVLIPHIIDSVSIDIWFYMNNRNNFPIIYAGLDQYNSNAWQWSIFNFSNNTYWAPSNSSTIITSFVPINSWVNAVIVRKSSSSLIYINNSVASSFGSKITTTGNIYIGKSGANYMNGKVASLKIYNKELSSTEIAQNYNATKYRFVS